MRMCYFCFVLFVYNSAWSLETEEDFNVIHVEQNVDVDTKFLEELLISFNYYGDDVSLLLTRDHETSRQLNEFIFDTSSFLPSGVYNSNNAADYSVYAADGATIIAHRENTTVPCKMYGRFMLNDESMVLASEQGNHFLHRVVREADMDREAATLREKREVTADVTNVVELFVFTDSSVYDFWNSSVMSSSDRRDITAEIGEWIKSLTRDVDSLFHNAGDYSSLDIRVYLQDFQVATTADQAPWTEGAVSGNTVQVDKALRQVVDHYQGLVDKFSFPDTDHIMVLTRYDLDNAEEFATRNSMCGSAPQRSASYINTMYFIKPMTQAIATTMGVHMDGSAESPCEVGDCYVMSPMYGPVSDAQHENPWKFSLCSMLSLQDFLENGPSSCLRQTNSQFDFDNFMTVPPFGLKYTPTEQCQANFGAQSSFCTYSNSKTAGQESACYNEREGCIVNGVCVNHQFGDFTPCNGGQACRFGACLRSYSPGYYGTSTFLPSSSVADNSSPSSIASSTPSSTTDPGDPGTTVSTTVSSTPIIDTTTPGTTVSTTVSSTPIIDTTTPGPTTPGPTVSTTVSSTPIIDTTTPGPTDPGTTTTTTSATTPKAPDNCVVDFGFEEITLPGCGCCGGCGCDVTCDSCSDGFGRPAYTLNSEVCNITQGCCPGKVRISKLFIPTGCNVTAVADRQTLVIEKTGWEVDDVDVTAVAKPTGDGGWDLFF